jgi:nucleoside-diphosphate-sugar epimerase
MKKALVLGAGGFIGSHIVNNLKSRGYWVRGVDAKLPEFEASNADDFVLGDLRDQYSVSMVLDIHFDEVYQLAADMGGAGYINTNLYDADVMHNSATINLNVLDAAHKIGVPKVFFSSSACVYNEHLQSNTFNPDCREESAYPAFPDSEYGWEKLFTERLFLAYNRQHGMKNKVARFHNIFGPLGTWQGGKEKSPAAICRKIAYAKSGDEIEIWGDGNQTRSFLYIDECVDGVMRLMESESFNGPVNIGSDMMISINDLVTIVADIAGKDIRVKHIDGPQGVRGRNSNNDLIYEKLNWKPGRGASLMNGLENTYKWIEQEVQKNAR